MEKEKRNQYLFHILIDEVFVKDVGQFIDQCLITVANSDVWHICSGDIITGHALTCIIWSKPMMFHLKMCFKIQIIFYVLSILKCFCSYRVWKTTHENTVSSQFAHIARAEFPYLSSNAVFFHQRFL